MTTDPGIASAETILDSVTNTREALSVQRVFGIPHVIGDVTVIPVARITGGAGGGGGEGEGPGAQGAGKGFGTGFGLSARPVGVYRIKSGEVTWKPTIDVDRLIRGAQVLAGIIAVGATLVALRNVRFVSG